MDGVTISVFCVKHRYTIVLHLQFSNKLPITKKKSVTYKRMLHRILIAIFIDWTGEKFIREITKKESGDKKSVLDLVFSDDILFSGLNIFV